MYLMNEGTQVNSGSTFLAQNDQHDEATVAFNSYISQHHKNYLTKSEFQARLNIFKQNYQYIQDHNAKNSDYKLGLNQFSDWSESERQSILQPPAFAED